MNIYYDIIKSLIVKHMNFHLYIIILFNFSFLLPI